MMGLQNYSFGDHPIRVIIHDDAPWFVARDLCCALDVGNSRQALSRLDDDEKLTSFGGAGLSPASEDGGVISDDTVVDFPRDELGRRNSISFVSESGMYALVLSSRKAMVPGSVAHRFRKWITAEVLPQIRRTGRYQAARRATEPAMPAVSGLSAEDCLPDLMMCREIRRVHGRDAARRYWSESRLADVFDPHADGRTETTDLDMFLQDRCVITRSRSDFTRARRLR